MMFWERGKEGKRRREEKKVQRLASRTRVLEARIEVALCQDTGGAMIQPVHALPLEPDKNLQCPIRSEWGGPEATTENI